jgi:aspartyl protease family protein
MLRAALLSCALLVAAAADARTVTLAGSIGERAALLVIDGRARTVAVGASIDGVKLVSISAGSALVEIDGQRVALAIGAPAHVAGTPAPRNGDEIVLTAGLGGHFVADGSINGRAVRFLVDTGATAVALGQSDADRIGIDWRNAPRTLSRTANGTVAVHMVSLSRVRIGDVEVANVGAVVLPVGMDHVLLGNTFLTRFQMRRENDTLRLERR